MTAPVARTVYQAPIAQNPTTRTATFTTRIEKETSEDNYGRLEKILGDNYYHLIDGLVRKPSVKKFFEDHPELIGVDVNASVREVDKKRYLLLEILAAPDDPETRSSSGMNIFSPPDRKEIQTRPIGRREEAGAGNVSEMLKKPLSALVWFFDVVENDTAGETISPLCTVNCDIQKLRMGTLKLGDDSFMTGLYYHAPQRGETKSFAYISRDSLKN